MSIEPTEDGNSDYFILCLDGGGSKTALQVIDQNGHLIQLFKDSIAFEKIEGPSGNINNVGVTGIRALFQDLGHLRIGESRLLLSDIIDRCHIVAGFTGIGRSDSYEKVLNLMVEWGVNPQHIQLMTDADMALKLLPKDGAILIAGTGSICLGKKDGQKYRVGGLGRILGDEGSGYQIGLEGIKFALAAEYGWGEPTALTQKLREYFEIDDLKLLIGKITSGEIEPVKIAKVAVIVFELAYRLNDAVAQEIVTQSANELGEMVRTMIKIAKIVEGEIHLIGGIFKSEYCQKFTDAVFEKCLEGKSIVVVNQALVNPALLFARSQLSCCV